MEKNLENLRIEIDKTKAEVKSLREQIWQLNKTRCIDRLYSLLWVACLGDDMEVDDLLLKVMDGRIFLDALKKIRKEVRQA